MKLNTLNDLLVEELKDLYSAESQLVRALPRMAKAANSPRLKRAIEDHLAVTQEHKSRLEQIFDDLAVRPRGRKCKVMESLIEEGRDLMEADGDEAVHDAALIGAAQRVEHYEIAAYGTARTLAEHLGHTRVVDLLAATLEEEKETDRTLTEIAESEVNAEAAAHRGAGDSEDQEDEED